MSPGGFEQPTLLDAERSFFTPLPEEGRSREHALGHMHAAGRAKIAPRWLPRPLKGSSDDATPAAAHALRLSAEDGATFGDGAHTRRG